MPCNIHYYQIPISLKLARAFWNFPPACEESSIAPVLWSLYNSTHAHRAPFLQNASWVGAFHRLDLARHILVRLTLWRKPLRTWLRHPDCYHAAQIDGRAEERLNFGVILDLKIDSNALTASSCVKLSKQMVKKHSRKGVIASGQNTLVSGLTWQ